MGTITKYKPGGRGHRKGELADDTLGMPLEDIAKVYGVTQQAVSNVVRRAVRKLWQDPQIRGRFLGTNITQMGNE